MNLDTFWTIIEPGKDSETPEETVRAALVALSPDEVVSYQEHFDRLVQEAYRWDLWGAGYVLEGGCSDDGFTDFRYALISKGRAVYEAALADADSLATVNIVSHELFGYVASQVYEALTGRDLPRSAVQRSRPPEPLGERWDFDDHAECKRRLPKVSEAAGL